MYIIVNDLMTRLAHQDHPIQPQVNILYYISVRYSDLFGCEQLFFILFLLMEG